MRDRFLEYPFARGCRRHSRPRLSGDAGGARITRLAEPSPVQRPPLLPTPTPKGAPANLPVPQRPAPMMPRVDPKK